MEVAVSSDQRFIRMAAAGSIAGILLYIAVAVLDPVLIPTADPQPRIS
jgi:hypothetical protein